ncbi:Polr3f [Symbiodinium natans]|uniref:DNA-directed RNA polymerase III subunit RPC6 n=1 Tax=Symbiodinium natans TaxID=878477 RepID=A0A812P1X4_9DINO|nr:Polr3f [Symbiodinium natans]
MALVQVPNLEEFYQFISERPAGVTFEELARAGWPDKTQATHLANALLTQSRLDIISAGDKIVLKAVAPQLALKLSRLEATTRSVYQQIEKAGDRGAWSKSLKDQTKLQQHTITKAIKELLKQQLIKEVKSVQNRNRKVFMLIDLEPSLEVSGGTWYKDGEFNYSWVETLREYCLAFMDKSPERPVSQADLYRFVMQHPAPQVPTEEDILCIMKTLELDEEVSSIVSAEGHRVFMRRRRRNLEPLDIFAARLPNFLQEAEGEGRLVVPCLCCPLRNECKAGGRVCPEKCEFLTRWLQPLEDPSNEDVPMPDW